MESAIRPPLITSSSAHTNRRTCWSSCRTCFGPKASNCRLPVHVTHAPAQERSDLTASVEVFDAGFESVWREHRSGQSRFRPSGHERSTSGNFTIPDRFENTFFFMVAELIDSRRQLISRSVYWPRCLPCMGDEAFRQKYRAAPQPALAIEKGPWLKPQVAATSTSLAVTLVQHHETGPDHSRLRVSIKNTGALPAFNTRIDIEAVHRAYYASDNFFWLAPDERRDLDVEVLWHEPARRDQAVLVVSAWNAAAQKTPFEAGRRGSFQTDKAAAPPTGPQRSIAPARR